MADSLGPHGLALGLVFGGAIVLYQSIPLLLTPFPASALGWTFTGLGLWMVKEGMAHARRLRPKGNH